jgi:hypothetical protein
LAVVADDCIKGPCLVINAGFHASIDALIMRHRIATLRRIFVLRLRTLSERFAILLGQTAARRHAANVRAKVLMKSHVENAMALSRSVLKFSGDLIESIAYQAAFAI